MIRKRRRFRTVRPVRQLGAAVPPVCLDDISVWGRRVRPKRAPGLVT